MSSVFKFKKFDIIQDNNAMKVNTDAVLLGAWSDTSNKLQIIDIGAGTGIISLMMAQRTFQAQITGIEINELAFKEANKNMSNSKFADRLTCIHSSIQDFTVSTSTKFDLIVSNPPYFNTGKISLDENRARSRHTIELSYDDLLLSVNNLLDKDGHFNVILPVKEGQELMILAKHFDLFPCKAMLVFPFLNAKANRLLISFTRNVNVSCNYDEIIIYNSRKANDYSRAFIELTKEFYLFM